MDRSITVRYFQLTAVRQGQPTFEAAIDAALALGPSPRDRQRELSPGVKLRLERANRRQGLLLGEVVRVQTENIPPEATDAALVPLAIGGLGHSVAFAYDPALQVIAIQFDPRGVSLGRFLDYLGLVIGNGSFSYESVVSDDAWDRYNRGEPRSLTVSIASPQNLEQVEGPASSVVNTSKRLAEISNAPVVTIQVSMGRTRRGNLVRRFVDSVLREFTEGDSADQVTSLEVKNKQEGLPSDTIDFIKEFAKDQEVLDLPNGDHDENYQRRSRFLLRSFQSRADALRETYGQ